MISMSSPRPMAPSSSTPAISVMKRTQRVHWMQRVIIVLISGPRYFSSTARLFSSKRVPPDAEGHRLVLQVALAALVADRAVERVVDEQELHHPFARLLDHGRASIDLLGRAVAVGRQVVDAHGARGDGLGHADHLDEAHAAVAGDRQALVVAEARDLDARLLARLQQRDAVLDLDRLTVDDELLRHGSSPAWRRLFAR